LIFLNDATCYNLNYNYNHNEDLGSLYPKLTALIKSKLFEKTLKSGNEIDVEEAKKCQKIDKKIETIRYSIAL